MFCLPKPSGRVIARTSGLRASSAEEEGTEGKGGGWGRGGNGAELQLNWEKMEVRVRVQARDEKRRGG